VGAVTTRLEGLLLLLLLMLLLLLVFVVLAALAAAPGICQSPPTPVAIKSVQGVRRRSNSRETVV
jgi:hypothetical protein